MGIDNKIQMAMAIQRDYLSLFFAAKDASDSLRKFQHATFSDTLNQHEKEALNKALNILDNVQQEHTKLKAEIYFQKWATAEK